MNPQGEGEREQSWPRPQDYDGQVDPMTDDDFGTFLDFDNIELSFSQFDQTNSTTPGQQQQHHQSQSIQLGQGNGPPSTYFAADGYPILQPNFQFNGTRDHAGVAMEPVDAQMAPLNHMQSQQRHGEYHMTPGQEFQQHFSVPPTPNSVEMYPHSQRSMHAMQMRATAEAAQQYQAQKEAAMAGFTPLVSPEVSTMETTGAAEFTIPGAYSLSPLTSPALYPQGTNIGSHQSLPRTAGSSLASSPIDLGSGLYSDGSFAQTGRPRKQRKKSVPNIPRSTGPKARTRKESVSSTSKRDGTANKTASIKELESARDAQLQSSMKSGHTSTAQVREGSTSNSMSPGPRQDGIMPPPPKPGSSTSTPTFPAKSGPSGLPPVTPASLMRLRKQNSNGSDAGSSTGLEGESPSIGALGHGMEDLRLPEAATSAPAPESQQSPSASAQQRSRSGNALKIQPALNSHSAVGASAVNSPSGATPTSAIDPSKSASGRTSRKRNTNNNVTSLVSPAIRPRISPSIKPLLPDSRQQSSVSDETHTLLLASKSNYQNLLEGNHLPGVTYPSELSTNLTSKRTSHKIAEQGRRNRINTALQEMQMLLPGTPSSAVEKSGGEDSPGDSTAKSGDFTSPGAGPGKASLAQQNNSKAATVEMAIDHIKSLNSQLAEKESENERLRKEMEALRQKLGSDDTGNTPSGSD